MSTHREDLENELAKRPQEVLVIAGAGVSIATDPTSECAGWTGLLRHGLRWCRERHAANLPEKELTAYEELLELGKLVPVASFVHSTLRAVREGEYYRWLTESVGKLRVVNSQVIEALAGWGTQIATTNYDSLIETVSGRSPITWLDRGPMDQFLRGDREGVLHLHGHYLRDNSVVLGASDYQTICQDVSTQSRLKAVLMLRTVVFVGCGSGLDDPNFGTLLEFARQALSHSPYTHFRLVRECEEAAVARECQGIAPLVYGSHYRDLGPYLADMAQSVRVRSTPTNQLELLAKSQADHLARKERLEAERTSLPTGEYVRRHLELAQELRRAGGCRQAALDIKGVYFHARNSLNRDERVRFGLEVAEMLLDDGLERMAASILQPLNGDIQIGDIPIDAVAQFRRLHVRCMNDLCAYPESLDAIDRTLPLTTGEERARLQGQRGEIQMLQGDLEEAVRSLDDRFEDRKAV